MTEYAAREVIAAPISPMVGRRAAETHRGHDQAGALGEPGVQGSIDALQDRLQHPAGTQRDAGDEKHPSHAGGLDEVAAEGDAKDLGASRRTGMVTATVAAKVRKTYRCALALRSSADSACATLGSAANVTE